MVSRRFVLVANSARADGGAPLDDLAGAGGRFDLVARFFTSCLLTSHSIRQDTEAVVLFTQADGGPVALRLTGDQAQGLRPDERNAAAKINQALAPVAMPVWQPSSAGFQTRAVDLDGLLADVEGPVILLDEEGEELAGAGVTGGTFVVGDHEGLTPDQRATVASQAALEASVGPVPLQADQVVTVVHNVLDRA